MTEELDALALRDIEEKQEAYRKKAQKIHQLEVDVPILREQAERLREQINNKKNELAERTKQLKVEQEKLHAEQNKPIAQHQFSTEQLVEKDVLEILLKTLNSGHHASPDEVQFYVPGVVEEPKTKSKVHSVRLKLVRIDPLSKQVQIDAMCFKLTPETTFGCLKEHAAQFWELSESLAIYRTNLVKIEDGSRQVETYCLEHTEFPEFMTANDNGEGPSDAKKGLDKLFENFHGLRHYLPPVTENRKEVDQNRLKNKNTSAVTFCFLILVLVSTLVILLDQRAIRMEFWVQKGILEYLDVETDDGIAFEDIKTFSDYNDYVSTIVGKTFFTESDNTLCEKLEFIGPLRIRQVRTQQTDCARASDLGLDGVQCFYPKYGEDTKFSDDIGSEPWQRYRSAEDTEIGSMTYVELGSYDGSGYMQDYTPCGINFNEFKTNYTTMVSDWFDGSVRAVFITSTMHSTDYDIWVTFSMAVEVTNNALVYPSALDVKTFQPNLLLRHPKLVGASIMRLIGVAYFIVLYVRIMKETKDGKRNFEYCYSFLGIMDLLLILSSILSLVLTTLLNVEERDIYESDSFYDFTPVIRLNMYVQFAAAVCLIVVMLRVVLFLSLHNKVYVLMCTIKHAGKNMFSYLLILCAVLSGYALVAQSIWGTYIHVYRNFIYAFLSLLLITNGHGDFDEMFEADLSWSACFFLTYFFSVVFFLVVAFMGIYMDAFRTVKLVRGYDEQQKLSWSTFKEWAVPRALKKLVQKYRRYRERRHRDEVEEEESF